MLNPQTWRSHRYSSFIKTFFEGRGVDEKNISLYLDHSPVFHDPFLMTDMIEAVTVIKKHIDMGNHITIFGDYDADGITSSSILLQTLRSYDPNVSARIIIPSRTDGYGLNETSVDNIMNYLDSSDQMVICIDNGTKAVSAITELKKNGIAVVVLDHHIVEHGAATVIGIADAVVNPQREDCAYPNKRMCAAAVGLKFAYAMLKFIPPAVENFIWQAAAVATVADVMDLTDLENRHIVRRGLSLMNNPETVAPFIWAIGKVKNISSFNMENLAFIVAPIINGSGRMGQVDLALSLVMEISTRAVLPFAERASKLNDERKKVQAASFLEAVGQIGELPDSRLSVGVVLNCGHGILGTVAAQLAREYGRPAFALSSHNGVLTGSGRYSGKAIDLHEMIQSQSQHLIKAGGHSGAVGLSMELDKLDDFITGLDNKLSSVGYSSETYGQMLQPEFELALSDCDEDFLDALAAIEPFGVDSFKSPVFCAKNVWIDSLYSFVGKHLSIDVSDGFGNSKKCLAWNMADKYDIISSKKGRMVTIVYRFDMGAIYNQPHEQKLIFEGMI